MSTDDTATDHPEPPCPGCGQGMEVQHVCEGCGHREAMGDVGLRAAFEAGMAAVVGADWHTDRERADAFNRWLATSTAWDGTDTKEGT